MGHAVNADAGDSHAFHHGKQHAAKGIAETVDQGVSAETVFRMFNPDAPDASAAAMETTPETDAAPAGAPGETAEADAQPSDAAGGTETPDSLESETPSGI